MQIAEVKSILKYCLASRQQYHINCSYFAVKDLSQRRASFSFWFSEYIYMYVCKYYFGVSPFQQANTYKTGISPKLHQQQEISNVSLINNLGPQFIYLSIYLLLCKVFMYIVHTELIVKFIYSEKATKFCQISTVDLTITT